MRRFSRDKEHKEGYEWLRFQESKLLTLLSLLSLLSLLFPVITDANIHPLTLSAHVAFSTIILKYSLTKIHIVAEDDGIYLEINNSKYTKIKDWNDNSITILATKPYNKGVLGKESIYAVTDDHKKKFIYEAHCHKVCPFIRSICKELSEIHQRRKD